METHGGQKGGEGEEDLERGEDLTYRMEGGDLGSALTGTTARRKKLPESSLVSELF